MTARQDYPSLKMLTYNAERKLVELSNEIIGCNPNQNHNPIWRIESEIDPIFVLRTLGNTCMSELVLPEGSSLISPKTEGNTFGGYLKIERPHDTPDSFKATTDNLSHVSISTVAERKKRDWAEKAGDDHWKRAVRLHVWHSEGEFSGGQLLDISRDSRMSHENPFRIARTIVSPVFVRGKNSGVKYNKHSKILADVGELEALVLISLYMGAFWTRIDQPQQAA